MENKREILLETAIKLFARHGFWNTSTAQIAREAGVATGTLFNYFSSKDILISEVMITLKQELISAMHNDLDQNASIRNQLLHVWNSAFDWIIKHLDRFQLLEHLESSERITPETFRLLEQEHIPTTNIFRHGMEAGVIMKTDEKYLMSVMMQVGKATLERILSSDTDTVRFKKLSDEGFEIFWRGISV